MIGKELITELFERIITHMQRIKSEINELEKEIKKKKLRLKNSKKTADWIC